MIFAADISSVEYTASQYTQSPAYTITVSIVGILTIIAWWKMFTKAGEAGWKSIIPFYNMYIMYKICWGNPWFFLLGCIPCVNFVMTIMLAFRQSRSYGHGTGFAIGLILLNPIFTLILGFGDSEYVGPNGIPVNNQYY